jgi:hypothetical protein
MLCASINDVTSWPFWKFLQLKTIKGVTDLAMLAFNSEGGSFEARINGTGISWRNFENVKQYKPEMLAEFLERYHIEGRTYFVYGGHGMGDYLELEDDKTAVQCHELAAMMGKKKYEAIVFDACFMANLDAVYHLRKNTKYIGACEGYMWESDTALDDHIFNTYTASAMSRFKDPKTILECIQRDYCNKSNRGDFAVLETTHVEPLYDYVQKVVIPRVYDRCSFFSRDDHETLLEVAHQHLLPDDITEDKLPQFPYIENQRSKQKLIHQAIQFEHALYPSELPDKHLCDLKSYLLQIAAEEALEEPTPLEARTLSVSSQGSLPSNFDSTWNNPELLKHPALEMFNKVVLKFTPPADAACYASRMGGLSITPHDFSSLSKPLKRHSFNRDALRRRADEFLASRPKKKAAKAHASSLSTEEAENNRVIAGDIALEKSTDTPPTAPG